MTEDEFKEEIRCLDREERIAYSQRKDYFSKKYPISDMTEEKFNLLCDELRESILGVKIGEYEYDLVVDEAFLKTVNKTDEEVVIPDCVKHEGKEYKVTHLSCRFNGDEIRKAVLGKYVKSIGEWCFANCKKLQEVVLNDCLEEIGECAFYSTPINEIIIPESVKELGDKAFHCCEDLTVFLPEKWKAGANVSFGYGEPLVERVFHHCAHIIFYDVNQDKALWLMKRMQGVFDECSKSYFDQPPYNYIFLRNPKYDSGSSYYMGHPDMRAKKYIVRELAGDELDNEKDAIVSTYQSMEEVLRDGWIFDHLMVL